MALDNFTIKHLATGISSIRYSEQRPDADDLVSDPELWRQVYFANRTEILERFGHDCPAAKRFEPDLPKDDDDDSDDLDSDD